MPSVIGNASSLTGNTNVLSDLDGAHDTHRRSSAGVAPPDSKDVEGVEVEEYQRFFIKRPKVASEDNDSPDDIVYTTIVSDNCDASDAHTRCVTEALLDIATKRALFSQPNFPRRLVRPIVPAHLIAPAGFKGLGMFATRHLRAGNLILSERPLIIRPAGAPLRQDVPDLSQTQRALFSLSEREMQLQVMLQRMTHECRDAYLALSRSKYHAECGPLLARARTNGWQALTEFNFANSGSCGSYAGVFDELSRMNHSCCPNAVYNWDTQTFSGSLRAVREIMPGEEITVAYCALGELWAVRQTNLQAYGFFCACPACKGGPAADARRMQILIDAYAASKVPTGIALRRAYLSLIRRIEDEGLEALPEYFAALLEMAKYYRCVKDVAKAKAYEGKLNAMSWAMRGEPGAV